MPICAINGCTTNKTGAVCTNCGTVIYPEAITRYLIGKA